MSQRFVESALLILRWTSRCRRWALARYCHRGEAGEEVREDGGLVERDECKTFAFRNGVWRILVVWGKEGVLDRVGDVQEGAQ